MKAFVLDTGEPIGSRGAKSYRFRGARGSCEWPTQQGRHLGTAGMWNFLWRLGVHPRDCTLDRLPEPASAILWATIDDARSAASVARLRDWIGRGGYVIAAGDPTAWAAVFGWDRDAWTSAQPENPYSALGSVMPGRNPELWSPPGSRFAVCRRPEPDARHVGDLVAVQGERQTPSRATLVALTGAPALVTGSGYCYLNANPFAGFQAWLQGQEDLQPWTAWRHRLFWLDEWASAIAALLSDTPALPPTLSRPGIAGLGGKTVVLRHDLDHSRDLSYLQEEVSQGLTATHAVLRDSNTAFWRCAIGRHAGHEAAFHYITGGRDWIRQGRARLAGRVDRAIRPRRSAVSRNGLLRQVRWAKAHGIGTATLHRHLAFLVYPEWIDAMHAVFDAEPGVLGSSSLFRGQVLRWGADRVDGARGTVGEWPDAQFPLWLPFKLAHAGLGGRRLRGWESASVMESEPDLVDQLLRHQVPHIPQRVLTLGYHPAHVKTETFARGGSLTPFRRVLDVIGENGADVRPLRDVYQLADAASCRAGL